MMRVLSIAVLAGCAAKVDRFTSTWVLDRASDVADTGETCATGAALRHVLAAVTAKGKAPHQALVVAELGAGLCAESRAWNAELAFVRARHSLGPAGSAEARDALIAGQRDHAVAARRFYASFQHAEAAFGEVGASCPRLSDVESGVYLLGLYAGLDALLHDKAGASASGVPLDLPARIARGCGCVDDAQWWRVPGALQAAAWAAVPGSGPAGVDPWAKLEEQATLSAPTGVRLAYAVWARIAGNAGRTDIVERAVRAHAEAERTVPADPDWALFDTYAREVTLHEADLLWTDANGHRAPTFGTLPSDEAPAVAPPAEGPDPFAE